MIPVFHTGHVTIGSFPPANTHSRVLMDDLSCVGSEEKLVNCSYNPRPNCDHREDIGLACIPQNRALLPSKETALLITAMTPFILQSRVHACRGGSDQQWFNRVITNPSSWEIYSSKQEALMQASITL